MQNSVWDMSGVVLQEEWKHAAWFVTGIYNYKMGSMIGILGQLQWEPLMKRMKENKLIQVTKS